MRRKISHLVSATILLTALIVGLFAGGTASAISFGQPDGETHPYVGVVLMVVDGDVGIASGVLISPNVFLTAGHVTELAKTASTVIVSLESEPSSGWIMISDIQTHPTYVLPGKPGMPNYTMYDVGVIILSEPVTLSEYGSLPASGLVDTLKPQTDVQLVGYGLEYFIGGGPPRYTLNEARYYALAKLLNSTDINAKVSANIGRDNGFACPGDSGGPVLLGETDTILALVSFSLNVQTRMGVTYASRVDIPEVLTWIDGFLP